MIIPEWLFQEPIEIKNKKVFNPKPLKQIARENNKRDYKQSKKEVAKKMIFPYYFTDRSLQFDFNINLDSHLNNHTISKITIKPNFPELVIQFQYTNKILKEMTITYARLIDY